MCEERDLDSSGTRAKMAKRLEEFEEEQREARARTVLYCIVLSHLVRAFVVRERSLAATSRVTRK